MLVPVYDIKNCGPRHRFVANGKLVHNSDSVNLQNLPSRGQNAKKIKSTIEAPPGHVIIEADSSQIEARVLAWLAEQADMLQTFRDKEDPYKKMAVPIYGVLEADVTKDQRQVGKGVVLGCGFGMGPDKFQATMKGVYGIPLELDECQRIVKIYRAANPRIVKLWKDAGHMLTYMTRETAYHFGKPGVLGVEPDRFGIRLPSGLYIQYPDLRAHQTDKGWQFDYAGRGTSRKKVYGALVVENVTQALARIIVAEQMLQIKREYPIALTVHDSALIVVPKAEEEAAKTYVEDCMRWLPKWAKGLPVDCEAGSAQNYGDT